MSAWKVGAMSSPARSRYSAGPSGAVAAQTAERFRPADLILEPTFTSLADAGRHHYFFLPVRLMVEDAFNIPGRMKNISSPRCSRPQARMTKSSRGEHETILFEAARKPKSFLPLKGDHDWGFIDTGRACIDGQDCFFSSLFGDWKVKNEVE